MYYNILYLNYWVFCLLWHFVPKVSASFPHPSPRPATGHSTDSPNTSLGGTNLKQNELYTKHRSELLSFTKHFVKWLCWIQVRNKKSLVNKSKFKLNLWAEKFENISEPNHNPEFIGFDSLVKVTFDHCIFQIVGGKNDNDSFLRRLYPRPQFLLHYNFNLYFVRDRCLQSLLYNGYIGNVTLKITLRLKERENIVF